MFTDTWRDIISIGGFVLTFAGLVYAIRQVRLTMSAANAARDAAERAASESQGNFQKYVAATAHRFFNEAIIYIDHQEWD